MKYSHPCKKLVKIKLVKKELGLKELNQKRVTKTKKGWGRLYGY